MKWKNKNSKTWLNFKNKNKLKRYQREPKKFIENNYKINIKNMIDNYLNSSKNRMNQKFNIKYNI